MFRIYPYKTGSRSVQALKSALNAKVIRLENSSYVQREEHKVINWGNSHIPDWQVAPMYNEPAAVAVAANKLKTLRALSEAQIPTVPYTTDRETALDWLSDEHKVFARTKLSGHSGEGITVLSSPDETKELRRIEYDLVALGYEDIAELLSHEISYLTPELLDAPLYTQGIKNAGEYRVHVFNDDVILYQKKSRRVDDEGNVMTPEGEEADVRNLASNWIYRTGNLKRLERVEDLAIDAIEALNLDFGAVDIIKDENGDVYVLEVNTAPGLGNTQTYEAWADAFKKLV